MLNTSSFSAKHFINLDLYFLRNTPALNYLSDLQIPFLISKLIIDWHDAVLLQSTAGNSMKLIFEWPVFKC